MDQEKLGIVSKTIEKINIVETKELFLNSIENKNVLSEKDRLGEIIDLNVGGKHFTTYKSTLCSYKNSMLAAMFSDRYILPKDKKGRYFIDRSGEKFSMILEFLRTGKIEIDSNFTEESILNELDYYGLCDLSHILLLDQWEIEVSLFHDGFENTKENLIDQDISKGIATNWGTNHGCVIIKGFEICTLDIPGWDGHDLNGAAFEYSTDNETWTHLLYIGGLSPCKREKKNSTLKLRNVIVIFRAFQSQDPINLPQEPAIFQKFTQELIENNKT